MLIVVRHELPVNTKFLLISAFLASYNPTKDDARVFSRDSGLKSKRRRPGQKRNKGIAKVITSEILLIEDVTKTNRTTNLRF
jgi:origin recognition complex subunit 5